MFKALVSLFGPLAVVYALGAAVLHLLDQPGPSAMDTVLRWSGWLTTLLNVLMVAGILVGLLIVAAVGAERGYIDSQALRRMSGWVKRVGYRVVPPPTDRYDEAIALTGLAALGYAVDEGEGYGHIARTSVRRFQADQGMRSTGWLDPATVKALSMAARAQAAAPISEAALTTERAGQEGGGEGATADRQAPPP